MMLLRRCAVGTAALLCLARPLLAQEVRPLPTVPDSVRPSVRATQPDSLRGESTPQMLERGRFDRLMATAARQMLEEDESLSGRVLRVRVTLIIDTLGVVSSASIETSSGHARADAEALKILRSTRFRPGVQNGTPKITRVVQPIQFRFEE
jgi:TonB family protein